MRREIDLEEISDGNRYNRDSMVRISCNDCEGCSNCCHDMGTSIILDPYDVYELCKGLDTDANRLLCACVELNVVDGIILPNIKMGEGDNPSCGFLTSDGKCSIHNIRPGFCRLFPLGRIYENGSFSYFNQIHECNYPNKSKVKIKKWLDIPSIAEYEKFVLDWHDFLKKAEEHLSGCTDEEIKRIDMSILNIFYLSPYDFGESFYPQFYERLERINVL